MKFPFVKKIPAMFVENNRNQIWLRRKKEIKSKMKHCGNKSNKEK